MKVLDYKNKEISIRVEMKKLFGRKEEFLHKLMELFKDFDLDDERLDCLLVLDQRRPYDEDIMYSIAEIHRKKGNIEEMERWYNKIRDITQEHDVRLLLRMGEQLVFAAENMKASKRGIKYLEQALIIEPKNTEILYVLVKACVGLEDESEYEVKMKSIVNSI